MNIPIGWEATTRPRRGASGLDHPTRPSRPYPSGPAAPAPLPISGTEQPRENTLDTRALAQALREQRCTIIDQTSAPSADYLTVKVTKPRPGMDPRIRDALLRIHSRYPTLSRRALAKAGGVGYQITAEGYKGALALLAPLLHPRARGEAPRWKQGVTSQQVSATVDALTKTVNR